MVASSWHLSGANLIALRLIPRPISSTDREIVAVRIRVQTGSVDSGEGPPY